MVAASLHRGEVQGDEVPERYRELVRPHVDSFDYFIGEGLKKVTAALEPLRVRLLAHVLTLAALFACSLLCYL